MPAHLRHGAMKEELSSASEADGVPPNSSKVPVAFRSVLTPGRTHLVRSLELRSFRIRHEERSSPAAATSLN